MKNKFDIIVLLFALTASSLGYSQTVTIDSLKRILKVVKTDTSKVNIYNNLANNFKEVNPDSTSFYANKAMVLSQKSNYNFGLATSYINNSNANIVLGNYKKATAYFNKAKTEFQKLLDDDDENKKAKNGLARSLASLGVIYSQEGNYYVALENYQNALKLYQEIGDKTEYIS